MSKPVISVIIPAYNEEKTIGKCILALIQQRYHHPFEIIVVDNNSTDKTYLIAKSLKVIVIKEPTPGPAAARNAGVKIAQANLLAFTDGDTVPPPFWLKHIHGTFLSQPSLVALVGTYQFKHTTKLLKLLNLLAFPTVDLVHKLLTGNFAFRGTNFAIKKSVFNQVGGFNPQYRSLEDVELASRVSKVGEIGYLPKLKVKTTDRRFRHRLNHYLEYFIPTYISVAILKKPPYRSFLNIR